MLFIFRGLLGGAGRASAESGRRRLQASRSTADSPPIHILLYSWLSPRLAASSLAYRDYCHGCAHLAGAIEFSTFKVDK
eukprot:1158288-Pelagomonas_calceolata.AAC.5